MKIIPLKETRMLKRMAALPFVFAFFTLLLMAPGTAVLAKDAGGFTGGQGGYTGPGPALVTVQQAQSMRDDTRVHLQGKIVQNLGDEKYLFRDNTGTIRVEIDDEDWNGQTVGPEDLVDIYGKVDKDWNSVEIEVKRVVKK